MLFKAYILLISNFRPISMDRVNLNIVNILVNDNAHSLSITEIWKKLSNNLGSLTYPRIHERIKKLEKNKLVEKTEEKHRHGAVHFKISSFGLIIYYANNLSEDRRYLIRNKNHDSDESFRNLTADRKFDQVVKCLMGEFFEEETIDSIYKIRGFPAYDVAEYIHECCKITIHTMNKIKKKMNAYMPKELLPDDTVIKEYLKFFLGVKRPTDNEMTKEIDIYLKQVKEKIEKYNKNRRNKELLLKCFTGIKIPKSILTRGTELEDPIHIGYSPPLPIKEIYEELDLLDEILQTKINSLGFNIISRTGLNASLEMQNNSKEAFEEVFEYEIDYLLINMFKDKKFYDFAKQIGSNFNMGFKQFSWYH